MELDYRLSDSKDYAPNRAGVAVGDPNQSAQPSLLDLSETQRKNDLEAASCGRSPAKLERKP